jgi:hypothetical protein
MRELIHLLETNANVANALSAVASASVALLALFVSVVSVAISLWTLRVQRRHNILSVRPLPEITHVDYEDSLCVKIRNNGSGPMIIKSLDVSNGTESRSSLIEWMPTLPNSRPWSHFSHTLENRSLLAGGQINLLELTKYDAGIDAAYLDQSFAQGRDATRAALSALTVSVNFTDVYNSALPVYSKKLDWFGRHNT